MHLTDRMEVGIWEYDGYQEWWPRHECSKLHHEDWKNRY
jgi:hypothetical protein